MKAAGGEAQQVTVYVDVLFAVNLGMDVLLLGLVKRLLGLPARRLRLLAGAAVGALLACGEAVAAAQLIACGEAVAAQLIASGAGDPGSAGMGSLGGWQSAVLAAAFCMLSGSLMLLAAFGRCGLREFLRRFLALGLCTAGAGGLCAAALQTAGPGGGPAGSVGAGEFFYGGSFSGSFQSGGTLSVGTLICLGAAVWFGGRACLQAFQARRMEAARYQVVLHYHGKEKQVEALWDTGNRLYEPYGRQPVHVLSREACQGLCETVSQVIYIPFRSVGAAWGLLPGIRMDEMEVFKDGRLIRRYERPWVAISREALSPRRQYEMLLHGEQ